MQTLQIRLCHGLVERIDDLVKSGIYSNRSDAIRDAVRRFVWDKELGSMTVDGSSVEVVREARKNLSKKGVDLDEINSL